MRGQIGHVIHRLAQGLCVDLVLLFDKVEIGVRFPQRVGKAAILGRGIFRRGQLAFGQRLLRLHKVADGFAPVGYLLFDHLGGVLYGFGPIGRGGLCKQLLIRAVQTRLMRVPPDHDLRQPRAKRFDLTQVFLHTFLCLGALCVGLGCFYCHSNRSSLCLHLQHRADLWGRV